MELWEVWSWRRPGELPDVGNKESGGAQISPGVRKEVTCRGYHHTSVQYAAEAGSSCLGTWVRRHTGAPWRLRLGRSGRQAGADWPSRAAVRAIKGAARRRPSSLEGGGGRRGVCARPEPALGVAVSAPAPRPGPAADRARGGRDAPLPAPPPSGGLSGPCPPPARAGFEETRPPSRSARRWFACRKRCSWTGCWGLGAEDDDQFLRMTWTLAAVTDSHHLATDCGPGLCWVFVFTRLALSQHCWLASGALQDSEPDISAAEEASLTMPLNPRNLSCSAPLGLQLRWGPCQKPAHPQPRVSPVPDTSHRFPLRRLTGSPSALGPF
ncbi:uncharacterized protein LOC135232351 [Loxodonta africana]|uniref:uncharacterized protein LOC135232351 n=1 Tax=Loxodonta africana TaxID=9785 RepID=UPI0030D3047F